jgi:ubiquitin-protein ligase E3 C
MFSADETRFLKQIIDMLNDGNRVTKISNNIDLILDQPEIILNVCNICHNLLTGNRLAINEFCLLYTLAFKPHFIRTLWYMLLTTTIPDKSQLSISLLSKGIQISSYECDRVIPVLATFCALFSRLLSTLHDGEFFYCFLDSDENELNNSNVEPIKNNLMPFQIKEVTMLATTLKEISMGLVELAFPEYRLSLKHQYRNILTGEEMEVQEGFIQDKNVWSHLLKACVSLLRQLYTRDLRCGFSSDPDFWIAQNLNLPLDKPSDLNINRRRGRRPFQPIRDFTRKDIQEGPPMSTKQIRSITILREIPFVVPFSTRVSVFQGM